MSCDDCGLYFHLWLVKMFRHGSYFVSSRVELHSTQQRSMSLLFGLSNTPVGITKNSIKSQTTVEKKLLCLIEIFFVAR